MMSVRRRSTAPDASSYARDASAALFATRTLYPADFRIFAVTSLTKVWSSTKRIVSVPRSSASSALRSSVAPSAPCLMRGPTTASAVEYSSMPRSSAHTGRSILRAICHVPIWGLNGWRCMTYKGQARLCVSGQEGYGQFRELRVPAHPHFGKEFDLSNRQLEHTQLYFGAVRIVSFGSRTILRVPTGADK